MNTPTQAVKRDGWTVTLTLPGTAPRFFTVVHGEVWELLGTPREGDSPNAGGPHKRRVGAGLLGRAPYLKSDIFKLERVIRANARLSRRRRLGTKGE
jgi:hypothetical protein